MKPLGLEFLQESHAEGKKGTQGTLVPDEGLISPGKKMYIPGLITWTNSDISICASPGFCMIFSINCDPAASNVESSWEFPFSKFGQILI